MCLGSVGALEDRWDEGGFPMGSVDARPVCLVYTPDAVIGDMVLTHSGYSLEVLDPARAKAALEMRAALVSSE